MAVQNGEMLLNVAHVKRYITRRQPEIRPGFEFTRISGQAIKELNTKVRLMIDRAIKAHPTRGKTFVDIQ